MKTEEAKIVFMGNAEFAIPALDKINKTFGICLVVTNPDKPAGRGLKPTPTPIKLKAMELNLPVLQVEKLKDPTFCEQIKAISPDIIVVIAFKILPPEVFTIAKIASFNVHPSLLPKYRGPAPINWQIINGEKATGLTTFVLKEQVDAGNIILQWEYPIPEGSTAGDLHDLLAPLAGDIAVETCKILLKGDYNLREQDEQYATKAPKLFPLMCRINWEQNCIALRNFIHGVSPNPGAWTILDGKRFKIYRCSYEIKQHNAPLGKAIFESGKMLFPCLDGYIIPVDIQIEGKKVMKIDDFLRGYRL